MVDLSMIPNALKQFAAGFYQGSSNDNATMLQWIDGSLGRLNADEKRELKRFLDDLLRRKTGEAELQAIWKSTPADYYVHVNGSLRGFFALVSEEIGKQLAH